MSTIIEEFDAISIKNSSVQYLDGDNQEQGKRFGAIGTISGETTLRELIKNVEGVEAKKRVTPEKIDLTISAHIKVDVIRSVFGISNNNLKPGVYGYSINARGKEFVYTADVIDEFEEVTKLIAFPRCVSATGFTFSIENGATEVAEMELTLTAYKDEKGFLYYEGFVDEVDDQEVIEKWHTEFTPELVELTSENGGGGVEG